jgi:hypothetical protein
MYAKSNAREESSLKLDFEGLMTDFKMKWSFE